MCIAISLQVLIVAGGYDDSKNPLSSTEKMTTGATAWTTVKSLPRALAGVATVSLDNSIILTGKCVVYMGGGRITTVVYCRGTR